MNLYAGGMGMTKRSTRRERDAAAFQAFATQYARKARKNGSDPNDRQYDHALQRRARRMRPEDLDALLRDGEDDDPA
jgi:hypothetical protein